MQATQTRSHGRAFGQRAIIAVAVLFAAVLITLSALYFTAGRTASSAQTAPSRVHAVTGQTAGHSGVSPDARDASRQDVSVSASGLRQNGPLP
jgi:uncharacterized membrane protein